MSIFRKNRNEIYYPNDGKKHFKEVIKFEGPDNFVIWRSPVEDFNTGTRFNVDAGQAVLFTVNGETKLWSPDEGQYTLTTDNMAIISRVRNAFYGGVSPNNCIIYYVNTTDLVIKWALLDVPVYNNVYRYSTTIARARGEIKIRITEPYKLMKNQSGTSSITLDNLSWFKGIITSIVRDEITDFINNWQTEFSLIGSSINNNIKNSISKLDKTMMKSYGINVIDIYVEDLNFAKDGKQERIDHAVITNHIDTDRMASQANLIRKYGLDYYRLIRETDIEMERAKHGGNYLYVKNKEGK